MNRFILRRVPSFGAPTWYTHGISLFGPSSAFPFGLARLRRDMYVVNAAPRDSTVHPLELLAAELERVGIVAEHLRGEEAWPT